MYFICIYVASCGNSTQVNSYIVICNGINDCADGSDEVDCCKNITLAKCIHPTLALNLHICMYICGILIDNGISLSTLYMCV